jgi:hypothetical protein
MHRPFAKTFKAGIVCLAFGEPDTIFGVFPENIGLLHGEEIGAPRRETQCRRCRQRKPQGADRFVSGVILAGSFENDFISGTGRISPPAD